MQIFCSKLISQFHSLISIFIIHDSSAPYLKLKGGISLECSSNCFLPVIILEANVILPGIQGTHVNITSGLNPSYGKKRKKVFLVLNPCTWTSWSILIKVWLCWEKKSFKPWLYGCGCLTCSRWKHCISVRNLVKEKHLESFISWLELFFF